MCPSDPAETTRMRQYPYRRLVARLLYISISTRFDITHAVSVLTRYQSNPGMAHWTAAKHVLRYLRHMPMLGITLGGKEVPVLTAYADASYASCEETGRSTTGFLFKFGAGVVSCHTSLQAKHAVALSSFGAEYYALSDTCIHNIWIRSLTAEIGYPSTGPTTVFQDNQSTISFCNNNVRTARSRHLVVRELSIHEQIHRFKNIILEFLKGADMPADLLTKGLARPLFEYLLTFFNMSKPSLVSGVVSS